MSKPSDPVRLFDVRAIERNIKHGLITYKDLQQHLDSLPDVARKGVTLGEIEDRRARERDRDKPPARTSDLSDGGNLSGGSTPPPPTF